MATAAAAAPWILRPQSPLTLRFRTIPDPDGWHPSLRLKGDWLVFAIRDGRLSGFGEDHARLMRAFPRLQMILALAVDHPHPANRIEVDGQGRPVVRYTLTDEVVGSLARATRTAAPGPTTSVEPSSSTTAGPENERPTCRRWRSYTAGSTKSPASGK